MQKHSEWVARSRSMSDGSLVIMDAEHNEICVIRNGRERKEGPQNDADIANADLIVRAVNAHHDLIDALEQCITSEGAACFSDMKNHPENMQRRLYAITDIARAALAKAKA